MADIEYYPENYNDLLDLKEVFQSDCVILSAGSNVLLPPRLQKPVVSLMSLNNRIDIKENGSVYVGCSVKVQKLIKFLQSNKLGGIEYLYSVPASVGGLVYMNGGRGRKCNQAISDYLETVEYLDLNDMKIKEYQKYQKDFSYRHSPFQNMRVIILSATFRFRMQEPVVTEKLIKERIMYSKQKLSADKPSCGTVFCTGNRYIFRLFRGMKIGGAIFSKKTSNWISNVDNATYEDVVKLICRMQTIHRWCFCRCKSEIQIIKA